MLSIKGNSVSSKSLSRGEQTQIQIRRTAHDLFIQQGYHGTSMRQIAAEAGIALGGVYNHFNSKEEIFESVFQEYHPYHQVIPLLLNTTGNTIEERVRNAANQMVDIINERPDFLNLMFIEVVEFKSIHARNLFKRILPQSIRVAEHIISGEYERLRNIPPAMLIRSFLGLFFTYYLTEILFANVGSNDFRENAMDYIVDVYLHGIIDEFTEGSEN